MIKNQTDAIQKIHDVAGRQAVEYLTGAMPETLEAIEYLVNEGASEDEVMNEVSKAYLITKEKIQNNIKLAVRYLIREGVN